VRTRATVAARATEVARDTIVQARAMELGRDMADMEWFRVMTVLARFTTALAQVTIDRGKDMTGLP